ncbi:hypothetical protein P8452_60163 [Trifolium repens]|nr:hypothetical protein P8452_60163 [Trifolium repens]
MCGRSWSLREGLSIACRLCADCVQIGLPMLILLILTQQYLRRLHAKADHILERFALLACIAVVWAFAAILTVAGAIKSTLPFQWGTPIFKASHVFGMMGAALVSSAESTGTYFAAARLSGATPPPAHVLSRSIGLQGISMLLEGIFGCCVGTIASVENVGLLGLTHIGSRRVKIRSLFRINSLTNICCYILCFIRNCCLIDVWTEVAGIRKGHIYGLGSESSLFASRQNYRGSSSSSTEWVQKHEFEKPKFERVELRDMVKQLMKSLNFQPKSYTRDQVHEDDVVDDNEDIVDNNDDNEDVVDNNDDNSDDNDGMSDDDESE